MVLLWRDPDGNSVGTMNNSQPAVQKSCDDIEIQRIASLEKNINEKDTVIAKLKGEIHVLKGVRSCNYATLYYFSSGPYSLCRKRTKQS